MKLRLADLLSDASFINWANQTEEEDIIKWEAYLQQNPRQQSLLKDAALIIRGISFKPQRVHPQVVEQQWQKLQWQLQAPAPAKPQKPARQLFPEYPYVAFTFIGILVGAMGYWYYKTR